MQLSTEFKWQVCIDLKVIAILLGLQLGTQSFTISYAYRIVYFKHFVKKVWRETCLDGPLVDTKMVLLPSLQIKFGLKKIFLKAIHREREGLKHFTGPDVRKAICDPDFEKRVNKKELTAENGLMKVVKRVIVNKKEENYETLKSFEGLQNHELQNVIKNTLFIHNLCIRNLFP